MRKVGWLESLDAVLSEARSRPFNWGEHDCCLFVARCAEAITGEDRRSAFPEYSSESEAAAILDAHGGIAGLLTAAFGEPIHPSRATTGDIVLIDMGRGPQPAVCFGVYSFSPGVRGIECRGTREATHAWAI